MSNPIISLLSDSDNDSDNYNDNDNLSTPLHRKRPRSLLPHAEVVIVDDPTPPKFHKSSSSTPSFVPETPFSDSVKLNDHPVVKCTAIANPPILDSVLVLHSSSSSSSGDGGSIIVESDDEGTHPDCATEEKQLENKDVVPVNDIESWLDIDSDNFLHTGVVFNIHVEGVGGEGERRSMEDRGSLIDSSMKQDYLGTKCATKEIENEDNERMIASINLESLERRPTFVPSAFQLENMKSTKTYGNTQMKDDTKHIQDYDPGKENVRLDGIAIDELDSGDEVDVHKKKNKDKQAAKRKISIEEKRQKKEQEKLHKAALKAETARLKQLEKQKKKLEKYKFSEKDIVAVIDPKVLSGPLGGQLLTMFGQKRLISDIVANPVEKSILWRMKLPDEMSQVSTVKTDIPYILLIYDDAEEFCKHVNSGFFMEHIFLVRKRYPSYTICFLTNRLMSFINKREQQKYKNHKEAKDWKRPPVEELLAKLTTQFTKVNSRHCFDESEVAEHVVGLTINLAKCHSRKKLTHLSVNANGGNVPKDCVERTLILKHPWLKALVSIPKVQPRFAIAIWKKYPTMKSLLRVYMDPTKTVAEKESLLEELPLEDVLGNGQRRLGEKCSKRVFRILMAQNGSLTTDDVEDGADYFSSQG